MVATFKLALADKDAVLLDGLTAALGQIGYEIVATAPTRHDLLAQVVLRRPAGRSPIASRRYAAGAGYPEHADESLGIARTRSRSEPGGNGDDDCQCAQIEGDS